MNWLDLLFIHWPIRVAALRPLVPAGLEIDTFGGEAWIGIVPFRMAGVRPRFAPAFPWISAFPELNVRTYVKAGSRSGVWFLSLDAASRLTVFGARLTFHLPYHHARMRVTLRDESVEYVSRRRAGAAEFEADYRPTGPVYASRCGALDHWLTERYSLFCADPNGDIHRGDVFHHPWPLQAAEAEIRVNTMLEPLGLSVPETKPVLHFARRLDTVAAALAAV